MQLTVDSLDSELDSMQPSLLLYFTHSKFAIQTTYEGGKQR